MDEYKKKDDIDGRIRKFLPYFIAILNLTRLQKRKRKVFSRIIASTRYTYFVALFHAEAQKN